jgi:hypothetical protein
VERGPIPTSARLWICSVYLPSVRAARLSRRIDDLTRVGDAAGLLMAKEELARLLATREFADDVLSHEPAGD